MELINIANEINRLLIQTYSGNHNTTAMYFEDYTDYLKLYEVSHDDIPSGNFIVIGILGVAQASDIFIQQADSTIDALKQSDENIEISGLLYELNTLVEDSEVAL